MSNVFSTNRLKINNNFILIFCLFAIMISGCKSYNLLQTSDGLDYFEEMEKEDIKYYASINPDPYEKNTSEQTYILKTGDKLSISVWNHDDLSVGSIFSNYNSNEVYGKWLLVNSDGDVTLPQIGKVHLLDLTIEEAEKKLANIYVKLIVEPLVVVKVLNKEITILGEVNRPGKVLLEKDIMSLHEVLGHVGGLGDFADSKTLN